MSEKREVYFTVTPAEDSNVEYAQQSNQEMSDSEVDLERYFQNISQCRQFLLYCSWCNMYIYIYIYTHFRSRLPRPSIINSKGVAILSSKNLSLEDDENKLLNDNDDRINTQPSSTSISPQSTVTQITMTQFTGNTIITKSGQN